MSIRKSPAYTETQFTEFPKPNALQTHALALLQEGSLPVNHPAKVNKLLCSSNKTLQLQECDPQSKLEVGAMSSLCSKRVLAAENCISEPLASSAHRESMRICALAQNIIEHRGVQFPTPQALKLNFDLPYCLPLWLHLSLG